MLVKIGLVLSIDCSKPHPRSLEAGRAGYPASMRNDYEGVKKGGSNALRACLERALKAYF